LGCRRKSPPWRGRLARPLPRLRLKSRDTAAELARRRAHHYLCPLRPRYDVPPPLAHALLRLAAMNASASDTVYGVPHRRVGEKSRASPRRVASTGFNTDIAAPRQRLTWVYHIGYSILLSLVQIQEGVQKAHQAHDKLKPRN
jgi:hypothetical protein